MLIIPAIDIIDGKTVRLTKGDYNRTTFYDADPVEMVKKFHDHGMMRIHSVDLDGAKNGRPMNLHTLEKLASVKGSQIEWSGGINSMNDLQDAFNAGAAFVSLGSLAVKKPELFREMLQKYGGNNIILSADSRNGKIAVRGWTEETDKTVDELIEDYLPNGLTQAIVTDISRDGTFSGIDTDFYVRLQDKFPSVTFTVSGGVSGMSDLKKAFRAGLARVIVGKALYENRIILSEISSSDNDELIDYPYN